MRFLKILLLLLLPLAVTACGNSKFKSYHGPKVTSVQVQKANRKMYLLHNDKVLKSYDIGLGGNPVGPKEFEGDGKTPEGTYYISHRNPNSRYHLSLGISYPNPAQVAFAEAQQKQPGGDIFIHGELPKSKRRAGIPQDWTAGCIAVSDKEIERIYAMVTPGTPIFIYP